MARAIEHIDRDIAAIEEAIAVLGQEFYKIYESYLKTLGQAVRQQLILAAYHLCTQGYPETFLKLSFNERQQLQQELRQMAAQTQQDFLSHLQLPSEAGSPEDLVNWQEELERAINQSLQKLSRNANRLIQKTGILPQKFPEAILEAASKAEGANEVTMGPPNLLNLLIEAESPEEEESEIPIVTNLTAIHLRLAEVEFADSVSMAGRTQLRNLLMRLNTMRRDYQKKQRERTIAEAESAWRASWFED